MDGIHAGKRSARNSKWEFSPSSASTGLGKTPGSCRVPSDFPWLLIPSCPSRGLPADPELSQIPVGHGHVRALPIPCLVPHGRPAFPCRSFPKVIAAPPEAEKWELSGTRLIPGISSRVQVIPSELWIYGIVGAHQHSQNQDLAPRGVRGSGGSQQHSRGSLFSRRELRWEAEAGEWQGN